MDYGHENEVLFLFIGSEIGCGEVLTLFFLIMVGDCGATGCGVGAEDGGVRISGIGSLPLYEKLY